MRDLPQRAVGRKGEEVGMCGEQQRIFVALIGWPFLALGDGFGIGLQAQIVLLDLVRAADPKMAAANRRASVALPTPSGPSSKMVCGMRSCCVIANRVCATLPLP